MRRALLCVVIVFILVFAASSALAQSCLTSSEDYAAEVVLTDYNLLNLRKITSESSGQFSKPAEYDPRLLALFEETSNPQGLSVKLQLPTKINEIKSPSTRILSTSSTGELKKLNIERFGAWQVSCTDEKCDFTQSNKKVSVNTAQQPQEVLVEINEELQTCTESCSGVCFSSAAGSRCIDSKTKNELDTLLKFFGISDEFEDLLASYRIPGSENIVILDIEPEIDPYINWQEAMRQELVVLTKNSVVNLQRDGIEAIASLSKRGQAGQNYRMVYDFRNSQWTYYDKTQGAILTSQRDCREYSSLEKIKLNPQVESVQEDINSLFYIVPTAILVLGTLFLIILVAIARSIRNKELDSIQQQE